MSYFNLSDYEPVENRIRAFWLKYPDGRLLTDLQRTERRMVVSSGSVAPRRTQTLMMFALNQPALLLRLKEHLPLIALMPARTAKLQASVDA